MHINNPSIMAAISPENYNIKIVLILAVGFAFASILGYLTHRARLSPILGYLFAGYLIGPYSPGFVADLAVAEQLAEIGVVLMMFGVGLHLNWQELISVKNIAIPGAIGQTLIATLFGIAFTYMLGWPIESGLVIGLSIGVASTVVMIRILADNQLLNTPPGHLAIGWLIVEDVITVFMLLLLPALASSLSGEAPSLTNIAGTIGIAALKCIIMVLVMLAIGFRLVAYIFLKIARTRSQELFTLTVLALALGIATGSAMLFGTSIALGAFIAGMLIGQTEVRHQAAANALPLKDAFAVIFFLSVGMLFNPAAILSHFPLFIGVLAIILIIKPITAYILARLLRSPIKTALIVAVALAQIGEFSFILSEEAVNLKILPDEGYDIIVACALISIAINPLLFTVCNFLEKYFDKHLDSSVEHLDKEKPLIIHRKAIVMGFGPIGQAVVSWLEKRGFATIIIDNNVDTIAQLKTEHREAVFGDASLEQIQEAVQIETAALLVITIPDVETAIHSVKIARQLNPKIKVFVRTNYTTDHLLLKELNVQVVCSEEETQHAFINALKYNDIKGESL